MKHTYEIKRLFSFVLALLMVFSMMPQITLGASAASLNTLYLKPNANWRSDGAWFAIYGWNDSGNGWTGMTDSDGDGIYEGRISSDFSNIIFCRMNASATDIGWSNVWNQTSDLTYDGTNNQYTVAEGAWSKGSGSWSVYTPVEKETETPAVNNVTVYCINSANWAAVNAYAFGESTDYPAAWPGAAMTKTGETVNSFDVYSATFDAKYANVIFNNNGNGSQTADLTVKAGQYYDVKTVTWYASLSDVPAVDTSVTDVYLVGEFNNWSTIQNEFKKGAAAATTATVTMELDAATTYEFKIVNTGTWTSCSTAITGDVSGLEFSTSVLDNAKITTAAAGEYVFTYDLSANTLAVTYPAAAHEHDWSNKDGVCDGCGTECDHAGMTSEDATCGICGAENEDYVEPVTGITVYFKDEEGTTVTNPGNYPPTAYLYMVEEDGTEKTMVSLYDGKTIHPASTITKYVVKVYQVPEGYVPFDPVYFITSSNGISITDAEFNVIDGQTDLKELTVVVTKCAHAEHGTDGVCTGCGATVEHTYTDGVCTGCGAEDPDYVPTPTTMTIFFQNNWMWEDIKIYAWDADDHPVTDSWPGTAMEFVENDGNYDIYSAEVPDDIAGMIINGIKDDGSGSRDKTPDIKEGFYDGICYYMKWNDGNAVESEDIKVILPDYEEPWDGSVNVCFKDEEGNTVTNPDNLPLAYLYAVAEDGTENAIMALEDQEIFLFPDTTKYVIKVHQVPEGYLPFDPVYFIMSSNGISITDAEFNVIDGQTDLKELTVVITKCAHAEHGTDGVCTACGAAVEHDFTNGNCACGKDDGIINTGAELAAALTAGGTVTLTQSFTASDYVHARNETDAVLELNGQTVTFDQGKGIVAHRGNLTIKGNGTITTNGGYALYLNNSATTTIEGGTIKAPSNAIEVRNTAKLVVNNGTLEGSNAIAGYTGSPGASVTVNGGTMNGRVLADGTPTSITGGRIKALAGNSALFQITGGTFETDPSAFVTNPRYKVTEHADGTFTVAKDTSLDGLICTEDELFEALNAGGTVKLGTDVKITKYSHVFNSGVTATLDMNGKTITFYNVGLKFKGNLTITGNGTIVNNVSNNSSFGIMEGGSLVVENGTITGYDLFYISSNNSSATIKGGTWDEVPSANPACMTITGGNFGEDPSGYVAEGYEAVENDGTWTVQKKPAYTVDSDDVLATIVVAMTANGDGWTCEFTEVELAVGTYPIGIRNENSDDPKAWIAQCDLVIETAGTYNVTVNFDGTNASVTSELIAAPVAYIGEQGFATLVEAAAYAAQQENPAEVEINVPADISEPLAGKTLYGKIVTDNPAGVTITDSDNTDYVNAVNLTIGAGVTLNAQYIYFYSGEYVVEGKLQSGTTLYVAENADVIVRNGGTIECYTLIHRYNTEADAGIYIYGDNSDNTVEVTINNYLANYSGIFYAKDATVHIGYILLNANNDLEDFAAAYMELDNTIVTIVGSPNTPDRVNMNGDVVLTLKNGSKIADVRDMDITSGTNLTLSVDETSSIHVQYPVIADDVPFEKVENGDGTYTIQKVNAKIGKDGYGSLQAALTAAKNGDTIVLVDDAEEDVLTLLKGITLDLNGHTVNATDYVAIFAGNHIVDTVGGGLLKGSRIMIDDENKALPIWDDANGGYALANKATLAELEQEGTGSVTYHFLPNLKPSEYKLLAQGAQTSGVTMKVDVSWMKYDAQGNAIPASVTFTYTDALMKLFADNIGEDGTFGKNFQLTLTGTEGKDLTFKVYFESTTGVIFNCN